MRAGVSLSTPRRLAGLVALVTALGATTAHGLPSTDCDPIGARGGPCFGLEPTFTSKALQEARQGPGEYKVWAAEWQAAVEALCRDDGAALSVRCTIESLTIPRGQACQVPPDPDQRVLVLVNAEVVRTPAQEPSEPATETIEETTSERRKREYEERRASEKKTKKGSNKNLPPERPPVPAWVGNWSWFRVCIFPDAAWQGRWTQPWFYEVHEDDGVLELATRPASLKWYEALTSVPPTASTGPSRSKEEVEEEDEEPEEDKGTAQYAPSPGEEVTTCSARPRRFDDSVLQHLLFKAARKTNLTADPIVGGGHVHIDVQSGFSNLLHVVNFMTRIHNLRMLPLNGDDLSDMAWGSPPLSILGMDVRNAYRAFLSDLQRRLEDPEQQSLVLASLEGKNALDAALADLRSLKERVYIRTYPWQVATSKRNVTSLDPRVRHDQRSFKYQQSGNQEMYKKFQHIRIDQFNSTIELRNIRSHPDSAGVFYLLTALTNAIAATPDRALDSLDDDDKIAFPDTDKDEYASWITSSYPDFQKADRERTEVLRTMNQDRDSAEPPLSMSTNPKTFAPGSKNPISSKDWKDVRNRFEKFIGGPELLCQLYDYLPTGVRGSMGRPKRN
jgi:hypothetical protein